jgi:DNA-binding response OmpR family regulator
MQREVVLVADDSMTIVAMVSARLERAGYDVVTATRGDEALELADRLQPVLVILDIEMPGLNGFEVSRALRERERVPRPAIILLTAHEAPEQVAEGLAAGADAYVTKPFSPQELQARIEELLAPSS